MAKRRDRESEPALFQPLTGANAATHTKIMALSTEEIGDIAIKAGIYTPDGKLTRHYTRKKST